MDSEGQNQIQQSYDAPNVDALVSEVFSGKIPLEQALQKLRMRLLDLSARNRLLNYRFPKGRCIQFVDDPNLDLVFERLIDNNRNIRIKYVPEPDPKTYQGKRPDVRQHAESLGIKTLAEFPDSCCGPTEHRHTPKLQALFYPAELDRLCRRIASEARMVIEETGTNMLYLIFGLLEFYEREDSERPQLAPLLAVPVTLEREGIDPETRTYIYGISYSGEDVTENHTLREKLQQDLTINLPDFDEDVPGTYLEKIRNVIRTRSRWTVRCQVTLGFLSFGKLAIWNDLDPKKYSSLLDHPLLKEIFSGGTGSDTNLIADDYNIESHELSNLPLIYDADSSQHSAIIDVLQGKNVVIIGPPGTGKSQTITNIIAAALQEKKTILFVSEKLAALEVVQRRLNMAGLGCFCLELHSHKTQKKKLLADLEERIDKNFPSPRQAKAKIETLSQLRKQLNNYVQLLGSQVGNNLGLTIHEVIWAAERRRLQLGDFAGIARSPLQDAKNWSLHEITMRRAAMDNLGQAFDSIVSFDSSHPWWGFQPRLLVPGDQAEITQIVGEAPGLAKELVLTAGRYQEFLGDAAPLDLRLAHGIVEILASIPNPPTLFNGPLFSRLFPSIDCDVQQTRRLVDRVSGQIEQARILLEVAASVLIADFQLEIEHVESISRKCEAHLKSISLETLIADLGILAQKIEKSLVAFQASLAAVFPLVVPINQSTLNDLDSQLARLIPAPSDGFSIAELRVCSGAVKQEVSRLQIALEKIAGICLKWRLPFDGSQQFLNALFNFDGLGDLLPGIEIDEETAAKALQACNNSLSDLSLLEIENRRKQLLKIIAELRSAFVEMKSFAEGIGLAFDGTPASLSALVAMTRVAKLAPKDLLQFRHFGLAEPRIPELVAKAEHDVLQEATLRREIEGHFFLDSLPRMNEVREAIKIFRRGDNFFNFLRRDWRSAKKTFYGISKGKKKYQASGYAKLLTNLISWFDHRVAFLSRPDYREGFGMLFIGLKTDFDKIRRLHSWYVQARAELVQIPGLVERVDLSSIPTAKLYQLEANANRIYQLASILNESDNDVAKVLNLPKDSFAEKKAEGFSTFIGKLQQVADNLETMLQFFSCLAKNTISPKRATELLQAGVELKKAAVELETLLHGPETIRGKCAEPLSKLGRLPCIRWTEYLQTLEEYTDNLNGLCTYLCRIVSETATPAASRVFIFSKLDLDAAISECAEVPSPISCLGWDGYLNSARIILDVLREVVDVLGPAVLPGKSVRDAIKALKARIAANAILSELQGSEFVRSVLQDFYKGIHTDLKALRETFAWGEVVLAKKTLLPNSLCRKLVCSEGPQNLFTVREVLASASKTYSEIQSVLKRLEQFGLFEWEQWQEGFRKDGEGDHAQSIKERLDFAYANAGSVFSWSRYLSERKKCKDLGLSELVSTLEKKQLPPSTLGAAFEYLAYWSIGRSIYLDVPMLANVNRSSQEKTRADFVALDRELIELNGKLLAHEIDKAKKIPEGTTGIRASERTEMQLLRQELTKQRRHLPIRQLLKRAGRAILALKPCFMMGPLSVSQYLEQGAVQFDLVVMDESSQLRPEEALGPIVRGKQVVVVGDSKQLPPTSFFERLLEGQDDAEEEDEGPAVLSGTESILDICQQLFHPARTLKWHYRSHHESLIAFSNNQFYNNKLIVFPSPFIRNPGLGLRYRFIGKGIYQNRQNLPEAQQVVDAVLEHMIKHPEESLGVATLNQTQRDLIEELLDKKLRDFEEAQNFLNRWEKDGWPFFIKNLENVQGDERDVVFISSTFGKAPGTTKVRQNFGPISRPTGWRRLNVLFTRARKRIELFTSMLPEDIVVDQTTPTGTIAFRDYLEYAKSGTLSRIEYGEREPESDFEIAVGNMLKDRGFEIVPQLGVSGFFIDIAVRNPDRRGEFLAAVECDGATYHSSASARDRDRIRQEILESLGWKDRIWRVWSTDWFYEPKRESDRLTSFLQQRRRISGVELISEYDVPGKEVEGSPETAVPAAHEEPALAAEEMFGPDMFVEVGDQVTYCFLDKPDEKHTAKIVEGESKPLLNIFNEGTPIAQALLGLGIGEEALVEAPRGKRSIRLLRVHSRLSN